MILREVEELSRAHRRAALVEAIRRHREALTLDDAAKLAVEEGFHDLQVGEVMGGR